MQVAALRFKRFADQDHQVWRLNGSTPGLSVFGGDHLVAKDFAAALAFALFGRVSPLIMSAAAQLVDEGGDKWIVERSGDSLRLLRNGVAIDDPQIAKALLLNLFAEGESGLLEYNISDTGDHLEANFARSDLQPLKRLQDGVALQIKARLAKLVALFDQPLLGESAKIAAMQKSLESAFLAFREVFRQRRALLADVQDLGQFDENLIVQLQKDVELIAKIEATAAPLLDPAQSSRILKEKLQKLETDLQQQFEQIAAIDSNFDVANLPWEKLISCLSKIEAFERLVSASERALGLCKERLQVIEDGYVHTLDTLLSNDTQITSELESCLSSLSLQLAAAQQPPQVKMADYLMKFIKPSADVPQDSTMEKQNRLETARMATDFALTRLGELHANLAEAKSSFAVIHEQLSDQHENLVHEFGKLKQLWQKLSREHRLPAQLSLAELLRLCVRQVRIRELQQQKDTYRSHLNSRKQALVQLEGLLHDWRKHSQSQKESPLDNPSILLAEAQGIIRYREARQQQLHKLLELQHNLRSYRTLREHLSGREQQLRQLWKKVFQELMIPELGPERAEWREFFATARELTAWQSLAAAAPGALTGAAIFSPQQSEPSVAFYFFDLPETTNEATQSRRHLQLLQALEQRPATSPTIAILLPGRTAVTEFLRKQGFASWEKITVAKKILQAPAVQSTPATSTEIKPTQKIQDVMNILSSKRSTRLSERLR